MKKTIFLLLILFILLLIRFYPVNNEADKIINNYDNFYLNDKISLKYVVLYDKETKDYIEAFDTGFKTRTFMFDQLWKDKTYGKISANSSVEFMHVKNLDLKRLEYSYDVFGFIQRLDPLISNDNNVVVFVPIVEKTWCTDGLSQGFNYNQKIYFCLENFFNPLNQIENERAIGLMSHKLLHGVGYNHQDQMFKQYQFIDWTIGLPETNILLHGDPSEFNELFFDKHTMQTLGFIEKGSFEKTCLDEQGFVCVKDNNFFCKDSWGPNCQDIDKDGILDGQDNFVFSSPKKGYDSDKDGIIDELDLCDNEIIPLSEDIIAGPLRIKSTSNIVTITFKTNDLNQKPITKIEATPYQLIGGFIRFDETKKIRTDNSIIKLTSSSDMWRVKVHQNDTFRPFYVTFPNIESDFFYEKEWHYFSRLGCNVPSNVRFDKLSSFDSDKDGLPDKEIFSWANKIDETYDWDNDLVPDIIDTLQTINGNCSDNNIKGVKDSDSDGFCDPGLLDYNVNSRYPYEFIMKKGAFSKPDICPYMYGNNQGCPS